MEDLFNGINMAILAPFLVIQGILLLIALVDLSRTKNTNGPKWMWILIVLFINTIGPVLYFIFGRRQR